MKRFVSTRYGFFALASLVCFALLLVIQTEHRWVAIALGSLYAVLSIAFFFEERPRPPPRRIAPPD
jgi:hypothetical protein